jgi:hypothetical protein
MEEQGMSTINRKCLILPAVAILALVYAGTVSNAHQEEGYQPAGAWGWTITSPLGSAPAFVTLHHNGTVSVSAASMFNTSSGGKLSPGHGVWERTGPKSFGGTTLYMVFDPSGNLAGLLRARTALNFAGDPDHMEGVMYQENASCADSPSGCADPLSPDLVWTNGRFVQVSGTRIYKLDVPE